MMFVKNKNLFTSVTIFFGLFLFLSGLFFFVGTDITYAQQQAPSAQEAAGIAGINGGQEAVDTSNPVVQLFKWLLYTLIRLFLGLVNVAASVFAWATQPEYISGPTGLLNLEVVYSLWKFIRDFFNLAFIFLLLFSAFGTIFQLHQFNLKKNFFAIIAAAILINFSFPITRIVIDFGNVPMYFFAQGIAGDSEGAQGNAYADVTLGFFKNSGLSDILSPADDGSATFFSLLTGVIFSFMFMITLFSLAIIFVFRLIKLVILLIFSPLGVAASIVPGLEKYGKEWWSALLSTVFFGPAAMLMLVIALRFMVEVNGSTFSQGGGLSEAAGQNSTSGARQNGMIAQGIFFIPIILMWMAMSVGNKFGIEGAGMVMKQADKVLAFGKNAAKKGAYYGSGLGLAKYGAQTGARKLDSKLASTKYGKYISPGALKKAFKDRAAYQKGQDQKPIDRAGAELQDSLNKRISQGQNIGATVLPWNWRGGRERFKQMQKAHWNTDHTDAAFSEFQKQSAHAAKHVAEATDNYGQLRTHINNAMLSGDSTELAGLLAIATRNNDLNELTLEHGASQLSKQKVKKEVKFTDAESGLKGVKRTFSIDGVDLDMTYYYDKDENGKQVENDENLVLESNSNSAKATVALMFQQAGLEKGMRAQVMQNLGDKALAAGGYGFGNMAVGDGHGHFRLTTEEEQAGMNSGKFGNLGGQNQSTVLHPDAIAGRARFSTYQRDENGKLKTKDNGELIKGDASEEFTALNGKVGEAIASSLKADTEAKRARGDMKAAMDALTQSGGGGFSRIFGDNSNFNKYAVDAAAANRGVDKETVSKEAAKKSADAQKAAAKADVKDGSANFLDLVE